MAKIDSIGTFIGEILESKISTTKANGYPQWVVRLKVDQKYVEEASELAHFKLTEPQYVDYSEFGFEDVGYFVLFNLDGPLLSCEQVQLATGWDGVDFADLNDSFIGTKVLFQTKENDYNGKKSIQISWIDNKDASPVRTLKALDPAEIKSLTAKFLSGKKKVTAAKAPTQAAKSAPTPAAAPVATPKASTKPTASKAKSSASAPVSPTTAPAPTPTPTPIPVVATTAPATSAPTTEGELPAEVTKLEAWNYLMENKGDNEDAVIVDAFMAAGNEVANGRNEAEFTGADWARVRDIVRKDVGL